MSCQLCGRENARENEAAGLLICDGCARGDLAAAQQRLQIELRTRLVQIKGPEAGGHSLVVEIDLPRSLDCMGMVKRKGRSFVEWIRNLFKGGGASEEPRTFEALAEVVPESGYEGAMDRLLANESVRAVVLELVGLGCEVEILPEHLWATARSERTAMSLPSEDDVSVRLVALAALLLAV